jgi:sulfite reductase beta subunit-like hemoprotein
MTDTRDGTTKGHKNEDRKSENTAETWDLMYETYKFSERREEQRLKEMLAQFKRENLRAKVEAERQASLSNQTPPDSAKKEEKQ